MSVAVARIEGVQNVDVSLNEGLAVVTFAPDNTVSVAQIRRVIRENGFTPKEAVVRFRGRLERAGGGWRLSIPGTDVPFVLAGDSLASASAGAAEVEGTVPETGVGFTGPWRLTARRIRSLP